MDALTAAIKQLDVVVNTAHSNALIAKRAGVLSSQVPSNFGGNFGFGQDIGKDQQLYRLNRGWEYSAVNALSCEAASQPVNVGRLTSSEHGNKLSSTKSFYMSKMTNTPRSKLTHHGIEVLNRTPLALALENPNSIQSRWEFVYSFVSNLNITGWGYIIAGFDEEDNPEFYSIPSTWITPVHEKGKSFARFILRNPNQPGEGEPLSREQVAFAHLPNPSDPLHSALSPAISQIQAIRIDDHIQTSQEKFFENGVFPSVVITVGSNPHPEVPAGIRPRLSSVQRRQVWASIGRATRGIANY